MSSLSSVKDSETDFQSLITPLAKGFSPADSENYDRTVTPSPGRMPTSPPCLPSLSPVRITRLPPSNIHSKGPVKAFPIRVFCVANLAKSSFNNPRLASFWFRPKEDPNQKEIVFFTPSPDRVKELWKNKATELLGAPKTAPVNVAERKEEKS